MPVQDSRKAPRWTGVVEELLEFFTQFEEAADDCQLDSAEKSKVVVRYTEKEIGRFWKSLKGFDDKDYDELKKSIIAEYPGAEKGEKYTQRQLERLTEKAVGKKIRSERDLTGYYAKFRPIAVWLEKKKIISDNEKNKYFWYGLHEKARRKITRRLDIEDPNRSRDKPPKMEDVLKAGRQVYSDDAFDAEHYDPIAKKLRKAATKRRGMSKRDDTSSSEESSMDTESDDELSSTSSESEDNVRRKGKKKVRRGGESGVRTRKVVIPESGSKEKSNLDQVEELMVRLHGLQVHDANYASAYARLVCIAPAVAERIPAPAPEMWKQPVTAVSNAVSAPILPHPPLPPQYPPRNQWPTRNTFDEPCFFCRDPAHQLRGCPVVADYLRAGKIVRHPTWGTLVFPDRSRIERDDVGGLKASVDRRWGGPLPAKRVGRVEAPAPQQTATTTFLGRVVAGESNAVVTESEERAEEPEEEEDDDGVIVWSAIEELEAREADGLATTRSKGKQKEVKEPEKVEKTKDKGKTVGEREAERMVNPVRGQLAYRYESKAADAGATKKMYQKLLDAVVPNVTTGFQRLDQRLHWPRYPSLRTNHPSTTSNTAPHCARLMLR